MKWVQWLLIGLFVLVLLMAWFIKLALLLFLLLIVAGFVNNARFIKLQKNHHLVINAQNQWHLVHQDTHQVVKAELRSSWQTPVFIAVSLSSSAGRFWYIMLRSRLGGEKFSRVLMGLHNE